MIECHLGALFDFLKVFQQLEWEVGVVVFVGGLQVFHDPSWSLCTSWLLISWLLGWKLIKIVILESWHFREPQQT